MLSFLLIACQPDFSSPAYIKAELIPPFEHGNSGWAGVSLLDFDGDGWVDIFFSNGLSQADALYQNQGNGQFIEMAGTVGLDSTFFLPQTPPPPVVILLLLLLLPPKVGKSIG